MFRKHREEYPDSPWSSEAVLHTGCDATYNGRYTEAEESFNWILEKNKDKDHEGAKILMNKAKTRLGILKVYQNNFKEAQRLFEYIYVWIHRRQTARAELDTPEGKHHGIPLQ
ncbi:MAG: hypothetical protein HZA14_10465 [Nitrospirae bacterium]|nr:hypothetical protein [Nitrospirota bacterium]